MSELQKDMHRQIAREYLKAGLEESFILHALSLSSFELRLIRKTLQMEEAMT